MSLAKSLIFATLITLVYSAGNVAFLHTAQANEYELCRNKNSEASEIFKQRFRKRFKDPAYAAKYKQVDAQLTAAEAATESAFKRLTAEIASLKAQLAEGRNVATQLARKRHDIQEVVQYQCETLVPARNRIKPLADLID